MKNIIGREKEMRELNKLYDSSLPQFVAVYGRRRVGKTFLIDQTLKNRITFRHTNKDMSLQEKIYRYKRSMDWSKSVAGVNM